MVVLASTKEGIRKNEKDGVKADAYRVGRCSIVLLQYLSIRGASDECGCFLGITPYADINTPDPLLDVGH